MARRAAASKTHSLHHSAQISSSCACSVYHPPWRGVPSQMRKEMSRGLPTHCSHHRHATPASQALSLCSRRHPRQHQFVMTRRRDAERDMQRELHTLSQFALSERTLCAHPAPMPSNPRASCMAITAPAQAEISLMLCRQAMQQLYRLLPGGQLPGDTAYRHLPPRAQKPILGSTTH